MPNGASIRSLPLSPLAAAPPNAVAARRALIAFITAIGVATTTGGLEYCYAGMLGGLLPWVAWLHEISGDAAILCSGVYLLLHLPRVWSMRRRALSWWSGVAALAVWLTISAAGVYWQFATLETGSALWLIHVIGSLGFVILACFHGVWGFRTPRRV